MEGIPLAHIYNQIEALITHDISGQGSCMNDLDGLIRKDDPITR